MEQTNITKNKIHQNWVKHSKYLILKQKRDQRLLISKISRKESETDINEGEEMKNEINHILTKLATTSYQISHNASQSIDKNSDGVESEILLHQTNFTYVFKGINKQSQQNVTINVSKLNKSSYEVLKYESTILKQLIHFDSVLQYQDEIDLPEENLFILITQRYEQSLEEIFNERKAISQQLFSMKELVQITNQLLYCYAQLHAHSFCHVNVQPNSIVIDEDGNYKLRNFIPQEKFVEMLKTLEQAESSSESILDYLSPEAQSLREANNSKEFSIDNRSDIFSLGLVLVSLMGQDSNAKKIRVYLLESNFEEIKKLICIEKHDLLSFVYNFMLNLKQERRQSPYFLTKYLHQYYEDIYIVVEEEQDRIQKLKAIFKDNEIQPNIYLAYLQALQLTLAQKKDDDDFELGETLLTLDVSIQPELLPLNLEILFIYLGFYKDLENGQKVLRVFQSAFSETELQNHIQYYQILGRILSIKEQYPEYIINQIGFMKKIERDYSNSHPLLIEIVLNLGNFLKVSQSALQQYSRGYQIAQFNFSKTHNTLLISLGAIGYFYQTEKKYVQAIVYHLKMLELQQQVHQLDSDKVISTIQQLAEFYKQTEQIDKSLEYQMLIVERLQTDNSTKSAQKTSKALFAIANVYFKYRDYNKALFYMEKAQKTIKQTEEKEFMLKQQFLNLRKTALSFLYKLYIIVGDREKSFLSKYEQIMLIFKWNLEDDNSIQEFTTALYSLDYYSQMKYVKILFNYCLNNSYLNKKATVLFIAILKDLLDNFVFEDEEEQELLKHQFEALTIKLRKQNGDVFEAQYGDLSELEILMLGNDEDNDSNTNHSQIEIEDQEDSHDGDDDDDNSDNDDGDDDEQSSENNKNIGDIEIDQEENNDDDDEDEIDDEDDGDDNDDEIDDAEDEEDNNNDANDIADVIDSEQENNNDFEQSNEDNEDYASDEEVEEEIESDNQ